MFEGDGEVPRGFIEGPAGPPGPPGPPGKKVNMGENTHEHSVAWLF